MDFVALETNQMLIDVLKLQEFRILNAQQFQILIDPSNVCCYRLISAHYF